MNIVREPAKSSEIQDLVLFFTGHNACEKSIQRYHKSPIFSNSHGFSWLLYDVMRLGDGFVGYLWKMLESVDLHDTAGYDKIDFSQGIMLHRPANY